MSSLHFPPRHPVRPGSLSPTSKALTEFPARLHRPLPFISGLILICSPARPSPSSPRPESASGTNALFLYHREDRRHLGHPYKSFLDSSATCQSITIVCEHILFWDLVKILALRPCLGPVCNPRICVFSWFDGCSRAGLYKHTGRLQSRVPGPHTLLPSPILRGRH